MSATVTGPFGQTHYNHAAIQPSHNEASTSQHHHSTTSIIPNNEGVMQGHWMETNRGYGPSSIGLDDNTTLPQEGAETASAYEEGWAHIYHSAFH